jgi:hypothetical protein
VRTHRVVVFVRLQHGERAGNLGGEADVGEIGVDAILVTLSGPSVSAFARTSAARPWKQADTMRRAQRGMETRQRGSKCGASDDRMRRRKTSVKTREQTGQLTWPSVSCAARDRFAGIVFGFWLTQQR